MRPVTWSMGTRSARGKPLTLQQVSLAPALQRGSKPLHRAGKLSRIARDRCESRGSNLRLRGSPTGFPPLITRLAA